MTVDELHQFIVDNYYCDFRYRPENNPDTIQTKGAFELQYLLNSPFKQYRYLLKLFKKELGLPKTATFEEMYDLLDHRSLLNDAHTETDENKKKFKTNSTLNKSVENKQWFDKKGSDALCVLSLSENTELLKAEDYIPIMGRSALDPDFIALMKHIEKRLEPEQVLCIENPSEITRTKLIAAYYHYACVVIGDDDTQTGLWKSFKDVYEEIDAELSDCLIESGFQPLSTKNLFDVFVVFLTYAKINGLLE